MLVLKYLVRNKRIMNIFLGLLDFFFLDKDIVENYIVVVVKGIVKVMVKMGIFILYSYKVSIIVDIRICY